MPDFFQKMIHQLRQNEEVMLYSNLLFVSDQEQRSTTAFLASEFENEAINYPFRAVFHPQAALWAAQTIYTSTQLILYREHSEADLSVLLPAFQGQVTGDAMLSADLCLRFLPDVLRQLRLMDVEDSMAVLLENHLQQWHYSGVNYPLPTAQLDFGQVVSHPCLLQLYANRVIDLKRADLAKHAALGERVRESVGMYGEVFWREII